jgi:hypothetical protein
VRLTNIIERKRLTPPFTGAADARIAMAVSADWLHAPGLSG